jgi:hypothetical protein
MRDHTSSRLGQVGLLIFTFAFFPTSRAAAFVTHLDAAMASSSPHLGESGWLVVAASIVLTGAT